VADGAEDGSCDIGLLLSLFTLSEGLEWLAADATRVLVVSSLLRVLATRFVLTGFDSSPVGLAAELLVSFLATVLLLLGAAGATAGAGGVAGVNAVAARWSPGAAGVEF
jgi:hypothetical protein